MADKKNIFFICVFVLLFVCLGLSIFGCVLLRNTITEPPPDKAWCRDLLHEMVLTVISGLCVLFIMIVWLIKQILLLTLSTTNESDDVDDDDVTSIISVDSDETLLNTNRLFVEADQESIVLDKSRLTDFLFSLFAFCYLTGSFTLIVSILPHSVSECQFSRGTVTLLVAAQIGGYALITLIIIGLLYIVVLGLRDLTMIAIRRATGALQFLTQT